MLAPLEQSVKKGVRLHGAGLGRFVVGPRSRLCVFSVRFFVSQLSAIGVDYLLLLVHALISRIVCRRLRPALASPAVEHWVRVASRVSSSTELPLVVYKLYRLCNKIMVKQNGMAVF